MQVRVDMHVRVAMQLVPTGATNDEATFVCVKGEGSTDCGLHLACRKQSFSKSFFVCFRI